MEKVICPCCGKETRVSDGYCEFCDMRITPYISKTDLSEKIVSEAMEEISSESVREEIKKLPGDIYVDDIYMRTGNDKKETLRGIRQVTGMSLAKAEKLLNDYLLYGENTNLSKAHDSEQKPTDLALFSEILKSVNNDRIKAMKIARKQTGITLVEANKIADDYIFRGIDTDLAELNRKRQEKKEEEDRNFNGIYRVSFSGKKTKIYCPRCRSSNCSWYAEQKVVPGKTKTRYTANLNPFHPFTLVNKKEKVVRKERYETVKKIMCNDCGHIFS